MEYQRAREIIGNLRIIPQTLPAFREMLDGKAIMVVMAVNTMAGVESVMMKRDGGHSITIACAGVGIDTYPASPDHKIATVEFWRLHDTKSREQLRRRE